MSFVKTLIVITGPTAVGKTALTLDLARHYGVPILNADSRQIYRELKIGTAAPTEEQLRQVKHYFVGTKSIDDYYNASMFEQEVLELLSQQESPAGISLLSGGSMMYIDAVCNGIDDIPTIRYDVRQHMKQRLATEGLPALVDELKELDPEHWAVVDRQNPRRVVHALEICHQTGRTYTSFRKNSRKERPFQIIKIGLNRDRDELYQRINQRVLQMVEQGLIEEAHQVYPLRHLPALHTVGYRELFQYFDGSIDLQEAIRQIQSHTREYMRKQLTWFKRDESIHWFHPSQLTDIIAFADTCIATK